ncbi:MAG TPA: 16S rRNA (adenine(1518)-N(6)/adenine(1519)-N(6))-dimethyltransferase RsmA [Vicinamibacterales bacterium]|nr:16S rRNA (adenine(1518)-N(6)/adenine(1519)-N(6))-dimethyltransferase RsmA [Vicinamibacterales bacterium]
MKRSRKSIGAGAAAIRTRRPDADASRGRAKRRFGQHFLEPAWVEKLVHAIAPDPSSVFLEIGPGRGAITRPLAASSAHVVAFEIDRDLAALARGIPNVTVIEGDFLDIAPETIVSALKDRGIQPGSDRTLRVAGNLPYNVASPILFKLVDLFAAGVPLTDATIMIQREVADRMLASPGTKDYGVLAAVLGRWVRVERVLNLPPGAFRPAPKVHSSVLRLTFHAGWPPVVEERVYRGLVQAVFTRRRKTLANALLAYRASPALTPRDALRAAGLDGSRRPETLELEEFARLADVYAAQGTPVQAHW